MDDVTVTEAPDLGRYEIRQAGALVGFAAYRDRGAARAFTHTEIDDRVGGRGLGTRLVRHALDDTRARGLEIVPVCSFVAKVLDEEAA